MSSKTVKVEMRLPELPEGFEYTGEYRPPKKWENYLGHIPPNLDQWVYDAPCIAEYPIVRKSEVWRPVTPADAVRALTEVVMVRADQSSTRFQLAGVDIVADKHHIQPGIRYKVIFQLGGYLWRSGEGLEVQVS